jgi:MarR family 2-MHQ and catechol resistance regulon transcriptional repressor
MMKKTRAGKRDTVLDLQKDAVAMQESLSELVRVYQFRDRQRICYYDVSVTQCYAISMLVAVSPMTLNKLAAELYLNKSTTSRMIDSLEQKGYIRKTVDSADARALSLEVTVKGKKLHGRIERDLVEQMKRLLTDFEPGVRKESARLLAGLAQAAKTRFTCGPNACIKIQTQSR